MRGLAKGWAPTLIGYSMQGLCKFGFYEVFKIFYANLIGEVTWQLFVTLTFSPLIYFDFLGEVLFVQDIAVSCCQR